MIVFQCPQCGKQHSASPSLGGRQARCACGAVVRVPPRIESPSLSDPTSQLPTSQEATPPLLSTNSTSHGNPKSDRELPAYGRLISLATFAVGLVCIILNHVLWQMQDSTYLALLILGPFVMMLGLGGIVDPRIAFSLGKYGTHLPWYFKLIAVVLGIVGAGLSIMLAFYYLA